MRLAHEPDFWLGRLWVSPSSCRVRMDGLDRRLEPRVMQVLVALARAHGATVTRDELVDACWDGRIVGDDAINRVVGKVRGLGRVGDPPPFGLQTISRVGFRLIAAEPPAPPRPTPADLAGPLASAPVWRRRSPRVVAVVALVLALMGAGWGFWRGLGPSAGPPSNQMTEVVAFQPRDADADVQRLSVSTGEALVRVMTGAGMEAAPGVGRPGAGAADAVFRVAGSVERDGDSYVVNAQVLDVATGQVLWSTRLERPAARLAGFEEEVALAVAAPLQCGLEDRRRFKRPMEPTVFALYLGACHFVVRQGNPQGMLGAARRLVDAAPDEPAAHAMYAIAQAQVAGQVDFAPADEMASLRASARAAAEHALALEDATPMAYVALALLARPPAWREREAHLARAREIDPNLGPARLMQVGLLREVGRLNEGFEVAQRAHAMGDPRIMPSIETLEAFLAAQTGDLEGAYDIIADMRRTDPDAADDVEFTVAAWWRPDLQEARRIVRRLETGPMSDCLDSYLASLGQGRAAGVRALPATCAIADVDWRVRMLAREGDIDGAYAEFEKPWRNSRPATMMFFYPEMRAFRADPRFMPLAKRMGLVDYWTATGRWPDFCAEPGLPYDCRKAAANL